MKARALWVVAAIAAAAAAFLLARGPHQAASPAQPIAFNHALHLAGKPQLACRDCHPGAEREAAAGLPSLDRCLLCHIKPQSSRPQEQAVRQLAARGGEFSWRQVTHNPGHVHFSHRAHVSIAHMPCATCHGDVATWTAPPTTPEAKLTSMEACVDCHRERGASTNCRSCHH